MAEKVITFKVYPEKQGRNFGWYFVIKIYPDKETFNHAVNKRGHENLEFTRGLTTCHQAFLVSENGTEERKQDIGHIHLYRDCLGSETISHEATHAAIGWAREVEINPLDIFNMDGSGNVTDENERFCYAQGQITRQIVEKCYELNLYSENK